jgi:hypothetical protein
MANLLQRLRQLRTEKKLTQTDFGTIFNCYLSNKQYSDMKKVTMHRQLKRCKNLLTFRCNN